MKMNKEPTSKEMEVTLKEELNFKLHKPQSVRTTFRLSQRGHHAIKKLSDFQGVKKADVFGMLISLYEVLKEKGKDMSSLLKAENRETSRRTYVLEKNVLSKLNAISNREKISRDLIVDNLSVLLEGLLDQELFEKQKKYRHILENDIYPIWKRAEEIEKKLKEKLGEDDPAVKEFGLVVVNIMIFAHFIEKALED